MPSRNGFADPNPNPNPDPNPNPNPNQDTLAYGFAGFLILAGFLSLIFGGSLWEAKASPHGLIKGPLLAAHGLRALARS